MFTLLFSLSWVLQHVVQHVHTYICIVKCTTRFVMRQYKSIMHLPPIMQTTKWITKMDPIGWAQPKMCAGNTRVYEESLSTVKQRTQEGCHDTRQGAQCSRKFLNEIYLAHQGWHISCDKFSNHTDNLNLQV
jgi:hypothetical protein